MSSTTLQAELTEAVNDSVTLFTVSQAEYTAPYEDIEVYVYAETGEFECQPIQMIESESGWERVSLNRNQLALTNCTTQTLVMNTQSVFQLEISW